MISKRYLSVNLAGLFITLTPRSETTDILMEGLDRMAKVQVTMRFATGKLGNHRSAGR